jgi:hypothetical protein
LASPSVHTRPNSVFTACLILVLDKIQSLDHARWGSLQRDSYSRTTIRHSSKPGPWCRRTRERYRRNRHNRSPLSHLADLCSGALSDGDVGRDPEPPWSSPSGTVTRLRSYRRPDSQADEKSAMPDTALLHCPAASAMARHLRNCEAAASAVRQGVIAAARIGATSEVRPHSSPASSRLPRSEKGSAPSRSVSSPRVVATHPSILMSVHRPPWRASFPERLAFVQCDDRLRDPWSRWSIPPA